MKTWRIPVIWQEYGVVKVEANTLEEAMEIARDDDGVIPLPEGNFIDGSWEVDCDDEDLVRALYNNNQEDDKDEEFENAVKALTKELGY